MVARSMGATAEDVPDFESEAQASRIVETAVRQYNGIVWSLHHDPDTFNPAPFSSARAIFPLMAWVRRA